MDLEVNCGKKKKKRIIGRTREQKLKSKDI